MLINGILLIILIAIFVFAVLHQRSNQQKKDATDPLADLQSQRKDTVVQALNDLNCEAKWKTEDNEDIAIFDYQSGHFTIRIKKDTPYIELMYLFFYQTTVENIQHVRTVCNTCNINSENTRLFYSISDGSNDIDVHASNSLLLEKQTAQQVLKRAMTNSFQSQNLFVRLFTETNKSNNQHNEEDPEREDVRWKREIELLAEQEIAHQNIDNITRTTDADPLELKTMLATALDLNDIFPQRLTIMTNSQVDTLSNAEAILSYHITKPLIKNGDFIAQEATLILAYNAPDTPDTERTISIHLKAEKKAEQALYFRVTATIIPLPASNDTEVGSKENLPFACSFLAAFDLSSPKQRLDKFQYMWKEAKEIIKTNPDELSQEQQLIAECIDPKPSYNIYMGAVLFRDKRFYEATLLLKKAFDFLKHTVKNAKTSEQEKFFYICYLLGFCYSELKQYEKALYFLEITIHLRRITYTEEYVNCMISLEDFRALDVIENLMTETQEGNDDDEATPPHINAFLNFLKRRKAYVLIEEKNFDEAQAMLQKMLDEPENSDFAISELAYLQKKKGTN